MNYTNYTPGYTPDLPSPGAPEGLAATIIISTVLGFVVGGSILMMIRAWYASSREEPANEPSPMPADDTVIPLDNTA
jgi:hypothetical protein